MMHRVLMGDVPRPCGMAGMSADDWGFLACGAVRFLNILLFEERMVFPSEILLFQKLWHSVSQCPIIPIFRSS
jgi:hypothetical protein